MKIKNYLLLLGVCLAAFLLTQPIAMNAYGQATKLLWYQPNIGRNFQVTTDATGTNWTQLTSYVCDRVILNTTPATGTSVAIEVRRKSDSFGFILPASSAKAFRGISNASDLYIRRADQSNTQVTLVFETEGGGF